MFEKMTSNRYLKAWRGNIPIESLYTAGTAGQKFLDGLALGRILGTKCAPCKQVYVPARHFCERCFAELTEYVLVNDVGRIVTFSHCYVDMDGRALPEPVIVAAVRLDGATTTLVHYCIADRPAINALVKVVFKPKDKRTGSILDIEGFERA